MAVLGGTGRVGPGFPKINKGVPVNFNTVRVIQNRGYIGSKYQLQSCDTLCPNVVQVNLKIWSRLKLPV